MSRRRITTHEDSAALLLPQEAMDQLGLKVGDEVEVSVVDGALIVLPSSEADRARRMEEIIKTLFERRRSAYERLAKGVE
ncbi:MAG TPA: AbrB/MazE/SpoVT family DNA-binding domain-containing protein [Blastocatellia bacterium]|jgi:antitoxin component of MazEF toxin-antitoxin module